jgi:hypothetical protein
MKGPLTMTDHDLGGSLDGWDDELTDWTDTTNARAAIWRRPGRCDTGGCIEINIRGNSVTLRESSNPTETVITTRANLAVFVAAAKLGEFDDLGGQQ